MLNAADERKEGFGFALKFMHGPAALAAVNSLDDFETKSNLSATTKNTKAVTPKDHGFFNSVVAMQVIKLN